MFDLYNGYKNYETWNVLLHLMNNRKLYEAAKRFMEAEKKNPSKGLRGVYKRFVHLIGYEKDTTPEGVAWLSPILDYNTIDEEMRTDLMTSMTRSELVRFLNIGDGIGVITKSQGKQEYWFFPNVNGGDTIGQIIDRFGMNKEIEMFEICPYAEMVREVSE